MFVIVQNTTWLELCSLDFDLFVGIMNKIVIDKTRAITPPSLFGIDRRIACANKKYHSGWMCTGDPGSTAVKVLCYKSEGRWFDSRWCHWNFSLT